ncbi:hypothetical protein BHE74_00033477 [Ensete ventricosum]|nr:hypothetical protein BHE74_00033477 [Ensete ventricosum]
MGQDQASASGQGSDDVVGYRWEFVRRFAEGIIKLAGNMSGDRQKKIGRLAARMPEATELAGGRWVNVPYVGVQATEPPRSAGEPPVPEFLGYRFGLHPKKIGSGCWCASRRRTREWT